MQEDTLSFYSNGKLLLTGEYVVIDGALSLAIPVRYGQWLTVEKTKNDTLHWQSFDGGEYPWFEATFFLESFRDDDSIHSSKRIANLYHWVKDYSDKEIAAVITKILIAAKKRNPAFLEGNSGLEVTTKLTFSRHWGLGASSTLINNIARWAGVNPYQLLWDVFPGSGYDVACAQQQKPLLYRLVDQKPRIELSVFYPPFAQNLYFVHRNFKQDSARAIKEYQSKGPRKQTVIDAVSEITQQMVTATKLSEWEKGMEAHERIISNLMQLPPVKKELFNDYFGCLKSLGAWGGDFMMATGDERTPAYFHKKGYKTVIPYAEMVC